LSYLATMPKDITRNSLKSQLVSPITDFPDQDYYQQRNISVLYDNSFMWNGTSLCCQEIGNKALQSIGNTFSQVQVAQ